VRDILRIDNITAVILTETIHQIACHWTNSALAYQGNANTNYGDDVHARAGDEELVEVGEISQA
jgi:hypothetical protein